MCSLKFSPIWKTVYLFDMKEVVAFNTKWDYHKLRSRHPSSAEIVWNGIRFTFTGLNCLDGTTVL